MLSHRVGQCHGLWFLFPPMAGTTQRVWSRMSQMSTQLCISAVSCLSWSWTTPCFMISCLPHGWNYAARLGPHVSDVDAVVHPRCLMSVMKLEGKKTNRSMQLICIYIYIQISLQHINPCSGSTCQTTSTHTWRLYIYIYVDMCIYIYTYIITTYKPLQWLHLPDDLNPYLGSKSIYIYVYIVIYVEMCLYINTYTYISDYII